MTDKKTIAEQIEAIADEFDVSTIQSVSSEMNRRFKAAEKAITELLIFAHRMGTDERAWEYMRCALDLILPGQDGERNFPIIWEGNKITVPIDKLDSIRKTKQSIADSFGVSTSDLLLFEVNKDRGVGVPCNHYGCSVERPIRYVNPADMMKAVRLSAVEIWYCHHHREEAYRTEGALSDIYLPVFERICNSPGISMADLSVKTSEMDATISRDAILFLEQNELVAIKRLTHKGKILRYEISLSDTGIVELGKLRKRQII